jgi:hypothetical protein
MKKLLSVLSVLVLVFSISACGIDDPEVDAAIETLENAKNSLNAVIADPSNVVSSFDVPVSLLNGAVEAQWTSSEPGVISFGNSSNGFVTATVNRPALGEGDAEVTITATLTILSAISDEILSDTFTINVTVRENTVAEISIENVADILALRDESYDGTYQVVIEDLTVIAVGGGSSFAYDGTGTIMIYGEVLDVNKVYTVDATIEWYYGLWELTDVTATEQVAEVPQYPTKEEITGVSSYISNLLTNGEDIPAKGSVSDGNFEPVYATLTGVVYMDPNDDSKYNTYIVDVAFNSETINVPGSAETPADGFMVYYQSSDLELLRLYNGQEVTIDVVIYTFRSNNNAFALYYVGGPTGISANLIDSEKQLIDAESLSLPGSSVEEITLDLPTTGNLGSTITWSFTNSEDANNSYVDLTSGVASVPNDQQVEVGLTATISFNGLDDIVKEFTIKLGEYPLSTIAEALAEEDEVVVRIQAVVLGYIGNNTIAVQDATGGIALYGSDYASELAELIGQNVEIIGERDSYGGLLQISSYTYTDLGVGTLPTAFEIQTIADWSEDNLLPYVAQVVSATNLKIIEWDDSNYGNIEMTLLDETTGNTIDFKWDSRVNLENLSFLESTAVENYVTFNNAVLTWSNGPLLTISNGNQIVAGEAPVITDAQKLVLTENMLIMPDTTTIDLVLPTEYMGVSIAWASDNAAITDMGVVTRPATGAGDASVTLTATLSIGTENDVVLSFTVTVPEEVGAAIPELFFSEYIEGSSNNKAIEIYNPTGAPLDLTGYMINYYNNGATDPTKSFDLTGITLAAGETYVICTDSYANQGDCDEVQAYGDADAVVFFNGNDALEITKNGVSIDVIGIIGNDSDFAKDVTIRRNADIVQGNPVYTESEWTEYAQDTFDGLGTHTSDAPAS